MAVSYKFRVKNFRKTLTLMDKIKKDMARLNKDAKKAAKEAKARIQKLKLQGQRLSAGRASRGIGSGGL